MALLWNEPLMPPDGPSKRPLESWERAEEQADSRRDALRAAGARKQFAVDFLGWLAFAALCFLGYAIAGAL